MNTIDSRFSLLPNKQYSILFSFRSTYLQYCKQYKAIVDLLLLIYIYLLTRSKVHVAMTYSMKSLLKMLPL